MQCALYIYIYIFVKFQYIYINRYIITYKSTFCHHMPHHVSLEIPSVTQRGGSKYGVHQGHETIWRMLLFFPFSFCERDKNIYIYLFLCIYIYNVCLIITSHHVSFESGSETSEIPSVRQKGGSKYGVHQGNGAIWMMMFVSTFFAYIYRYIHVYTYIYIYKYIYIYCKSKKYHHVSSYLMIFKHCSI